MSDTLHIGAAPVLPAAARPEPSPPVASQQFTPLFARAQGAAEPAATAEQESVEARASAGSLGAPANVLEALAGLLAQSSTAWTPSGITLFAAGETAGADASIERSAQAVRWLHAGVQASRGELHTVQPAGPALIRRVADAVCSLVGGRGRVVVRLHPPRLGTVWVKVSSAGPAVRVELKTDSPETQALLARQAGELRRRLEAASVRIDRFDVTTFENQGRRQGDRGYGAEERVDKLSRRQVNKQTKEQKGAEIREQEDKARRLWRNAHADSRYSH